MVINLKFQKFDDSPWGFRLIGGIDFDIPVTVTKVVEGSIAHEAGLMEGDIIVRINETPTINLTHPDIHALLKKSGNNFMLGVRRDQESNIEENTTSKQLNVNKTMEITHENHAYSASSNVSVHSMHSEKTSSLHSESICESRSQSRSVSRSEAHSEAHFEVNKQENHIEEKISEEAIAELMSGEAEVLKDHNVIGVNFKRIIPKANHVKSSEVFNQLNNEALKTQEEIEKEQRKWSTFLQKPNRPIPKTKKELEKEEKLKAETYKVRIIKQPQPKIAPGRTPTPPPIIEVEHPKDEPKIEEIINEQSEIDDRKSENEEDKSIQEEQSEIHDDEIPDLILSENDSRPTTSLSNHTDNQNDMTDEIKSINEECNEIKDEQIIEKTQEEIYLEKQLAALQQQLMALSNLPLTIQAALTEVTKKLNDIVPAIAQVKEKKLNSERTENNVSINEENVNIETLSMEDQEKHETDQTLTETCEKDSETKENNCSETTEEQISDEKQQNEFADTNGNISEEQNEEQKKENNNQNEEEICLKDPEWQYEKRQANLKEQLKEELEEEHRQRLIRERSSKPSRFAFGPLTPQERPIFLPGGRKWRNPKDAYNDEFIAEVLTSQAELIVGTTLGVNFLKYKKPEKEVNIQQSEVYRLIHDLDNGPKTGIAMRSEKVAAIQDIRVN